MPVILTTIATALTAGFTALTAGFTISGVVSFALKTAALIGLQFLLRKRQPEAPIPDVTQSQTFSSGPARWILGRARVGGVVCFATVDEEVPRTALGGRGGDGKASDLHLVMALSEGDCDAIEAVYVGDDRFDLEFTSTGHYARRNYKSGDTDQIVEGLGIILKQEKNAYYYAAEDRWIDTSPYDPDLSARRLDPEDNTDAERIRISQLANAITVWPYLNSDTPAVNRFRSVRFYTARDFNTTDGEDSLWNTGTGFGAQWTSNHSLDGIASVHIKLRQRAGRDFDKRTFKSGFPQISFLVRGLRITFPNPDDSGATTKTEWTDNAAAVRYWWHTNRLEVPTTAIDTPTFIRAYTHCNTTITPTVPDIFPGYPDDAKPEWATNDNLLSFRRYSINGVLASGEKPSAIEAEFDDAFQGVVVEDGGSLFYYPGGVNTTEADTIDGFDLQDFPVITPAPSLTERVNAVSINIDQSTFLDFKNQAIRDIVDEDKLQLVDDDLYLPHDLGTFRWITNPAHAYLLGVINLRRARNSTTIAMHLPPGNIRRRTESDDDSSPLTSDDPIKYLTMSIGQLYSVTIDAEEIEGRQMMLIEKTINPDFSVQATFVDSPADLYEGSYLLPALDPPPRYVPSRMGSRPAKPTGLTIESETTIGDDGTWEFEVDVKVDISPLPTIFRLVAGDTSLYSPPVRDGAYTFKIVGQRQQFRIQARSIDTEGVESLPTVGFHTPSYANIVLPQPVWSRVIPLGANLQITFESVAYSTPISGVEMRYSRLNLDGTNDDGDQIGEPPDLTVANWESTGVLLETRPIQIVRGLDITVGALLAKSGIYKIYARFVSPISGVTQTRGPISQVYRIEYEAPSVPINTFEEAPLWNGTAHNLWKWTATAGNTEGYPLMMPAHEGTGSNRTAKIQDRTDILLDHWNGNVSNTTITTEPIPAWPFGNCAGYDQALDESGRTNANMQVLDGGTSTWYRTLPIDLGTQKAVDVRGEVFSYAPASEQISNLTFGNAAVLHQVWLPNSAIRAITLPAARSGIGTISYTIEGVPAGITLGIDRVLSGTVSVGSATGTATLIARDAGGGEARLSFTWAIIAGIGTPIRVNTPTASSITRTEATISWAVVSGTSYYELAYTPSGGTEATVDDIFNTSYRLTGLTAATQYTVKVRAINSNATPGTYSPTATFTTSAALTAPSTPTGLTLTLVNGIRARWNAGTDVSTYELQYKKTSEASYPAANLKTVITTNEYTIQNALLDASTSYDVQVRARNSAGVSAFSTAQTITSLGAVPSAPSITAVADGTQNTPSVLITVSTVTGSNQTQIEVKAEPGDGVYSSDPTIRSFTTSSPFEILNVREGYTYTFRARKRVAGNRYTEWSAEYNYVKGDVPAEPAGISTNIFNPPTSTTIPILWSKAQDSNNVDAPNYRIRYWPTAHPTNVSQITRTGTSNASQSYTITGLSSNISYTIEVNGTNANGHGLAASLTASTGVLIPASPHPPTNLTAVAWGPGNAHFNWDNNPLNATNDEATAVNYEIRATGQNTVTGITDEFFSTSALEPETDYVFQVRAKYQNSNSYSAWVSFPSITTEPLSVPTRHQFPSTTNLSLTPSSTNRTIGYSFTTPVTSNIAYFQIRYREAFIREVGGSRRLYRNRVGEWHYFNITNTFTTGTRTFTGTFDPGFSRCVYKVEVRAYFSANDSTLNASKGFGQWKATNNSQTITPYRTGNSFADRYTIDTSRTETITGMVYNSYNRLTAPVINVEQIALDGFDDRFYVQIDWDNNEDEIEFPSTYAASYAFFRTNRSPNYTVFPFTVANQRRDIDRLVYGGGQDKDTTNLITPPPYWEVGDVLSIEIRKTDNGIINDLIPAQGISDATLSYTLTTQPVVSLPNIAGITYEVENEDVIATIAEVPEADGYEFTLTEDDPGPGTGTSVRVAQTSGSHSYRKIGGRNELFTLAVRAYHGSGADRIYSPSSFSRVYAPGTDVATLGKITGLRSARDSDSTDFNWNAVRLNPNYECQYSTNNGTTWQVNSSRYRNTNSFTLTSTEASLTGDVQMRVRAVRGSVLASPTTLGRSWTTIGFKAVASNEGSGGPGRIRQLVASSRNDKVHLSWSAITGTISRQEIESSTSAAGPWSLEAVNASPSTTEWQTDRSAYTDRFFRVRGSSDESDGDWSYVFHSGDTGVTIGAVPVIDNVGTYTTITTTWSAAPAATAYDVQYQKSGDLGWVSHLSNYTGNRRTVITGLDTGSTYTVRIRGRDHLDESLVGPWFSENESTLSCTGLTPPTFDTSINGEDLRVTWTAVTNATAYTIEVSVGNTVHKTETVTGTSKAYTSSDFPNIVRPSNVSVRMKALLGDCPNSQFGSKVTKNWASGINFIRGTEGSGFRRISGRLENISSTSGAFLINYSDITGGYIFQDEYRIRIRFDLGTLQVGNTHSAEIDFRGTLPTTMQNSSVRPGIGIASLNIGLVYPNDSYRADFEGSEHLRAGFSSQKMSVSFTINTNTNITGAQLLYDFRISKSSFDSLTSQQRDAIFPVALKVSNPPSGAGGTITKAVSAGASGATINIDPDQYTITEAEPITELVRPYFSKALEYQIWQTGETVDYTLPEIVGGKAPYRILANNIPGGISFDSDTRTFSGTVTNSAPDTGYTTIDLIDANDLIEKVYLPWAIATTAQPTPVSGSGFGLIIHPFEISCLLKGNMRGYLGSRANGGTNAADIVNNTGHARNLCTWYQCPTRGAKFVRLRKAAAPDFDLVVKIGDEFIFSDTNDEDEFIRYDDSDHVAGALIGIYKYSATTVTSGLTETNPQPIILEWGPQIDTPTARSGESGGAIATGSGYSNEVTAAAPPPGFDETDIYVLWRSGTDGAWTKQGPIVGWQEVKASGSSNAATNVRQIRFEAHLKKWRNRAMIRFNTGWRDS